MFTNFGFHYPLTVALLQMAFIAPVSYVVARPQLNMALVRQLAPLAMVNVMNVVCGLIGGCAQVRCAGRRACTDSRRRLSRVERWSKAAASTSGLTQPRAAGTAGLNVPMFIALRRFTLLFTILLERYWLKKTHDWPTLSAMGIMIGGACALAEPRPAGHRLPALLPADPPRPPQVRSWRRPPT